jgi:hypothetical protein
MEKAFLCQKYLPFGILSNEVPWITGKKNRQGGVAEIGSGSAVLKYVTHANK